MQEYQKIPPIFKRDTQTQKIIPEYISDEVKYLANNLWDYSEKIDGTNIRVHWDGHRIELAGRTDTAQFQGDLKTYLTNKFMTPEMEETFEQLFGEKDVILFGEGYGYKVQFSNNVYLKDKELSFKLFDVMINGFYLAKKDMLDIAESLGLDHITILGQDTLPNLVEKIKEHPNSPFIKSYKNEEYEMEGYVATPVVPLCDKRGKRIIVKIKWNDIKNLLSIS